MLRALRFVTGAGPAEIGAKPDIDARRVKIGGAIESEKYDIVGLSEVFSPDDRAALLAEIPQHQVEIGVETPSVPVGGQNLRVEGPKGSGLCTLTRGPDGSRPSIVESDRIAFTDPGYILRDTDAFAGKGVLFTRLDLGPGHIDVYTAHLLSGNDIPSGVEIAVRVATGVTTLGLSEIGWRKEKKPVRDIRISQVRELADFVRRTRDHQNPVIVLGDFNIEAEPSVPGSEYQELLEIMYDLGLQDTWLNRGSAWGGTHDADNTCEREPDSGLAFRCVDYPDGSVPQRSKRIDYVFVELSSRDHSFTLDISRIRRASFWRGNNQPTPYLSDHLGLEFTLIASPR
jgi:hypothetical protein